MFGNPCLGGLAYEGVTSAIVLAGLFVSFLIEYAGHRFILLRNRHNPPLEETSSNDETLPSSKPDAGGSATKGVTLANLGHHHCGGSLSPNSHLSILVMEAGILFHSVLIGLTLVVAGDSFFITLFIVIVFHQFFEGLALGARVTLLAPPTDGEKRWLSHKMTKILLGLAFTLITPLGMAIGLGVLNSFNGNDPSTIIAIGTLDALSAGILLWVGTVEMLARDWVVEGGEISGTAGDLGIAISPALIAWITQRFNMTNRLGFLTQCHYLDSMIQSTSATVF